MINVRDRNAIKVVKQAVSQVKSSGWVITRETHDDYGRNEKVKRCTPAGALMVDKPRVHREIVDDVAFFYQEVDKGQATAVLHGFMGWEDEATPFCKKYYWRLFDLGVELAKEHEA